MWGEALLWSAALVGARGSLSDGTTGVEPWGWSDRIAGRSPGRVRAELLRVKGQSVGCPGVGPPGSFGPNHWVGSGGWFEHTTSGGAFGLCRPDRSEVE